MQASELARYDPGPAAWSFRALPAETQAQELLCSADDGCKSCGTLYRTSDSDVLAILIHPRGDMRRHYLIPALLRRGIAVWAHATRFTDTDSLLVDDLFLDISAVLRRAQELGFRHMIAIGNSSGGPVLAAYQAHAQVSRQLGERLEQPTFSGMVYLASMLSHSDLLSRVIDPALRDERDAGDRDDTLDMYNPKNGFRPLPRSSEYTPDFLRRYRAGQRARIARIDSYAQRLCAEWNHELRRLGIPKLRDVPADELARVEKRAGLPRELHIQCTEANPAYTDLSLEPNRRSIGSFFSARPDLSNFSSFGFAQTVTPFAWLSTWSVNHAYPPAPLTLPQLHLPSLVLNYDGDHVITFGDGRSIYDACAATDKERIEIAGDHLGLDASTPTDRSGQQVAGNTIAAWISERFR